ncbi:hypothetical protein AB4279_21765 [Vibrio cyclitrophicus]
MTVCIIGVEFGYTNYKNSAEKPSTISRGLSAFALRLAIFDNIKVWTASK